jgi:putative ABC transport system permease protein
LTSNRGMARLAWGTSLRGLASRKGLAVGSWVLTTIAVASAVVGPSYAGTSANSFVVTQLRAEPRVNTGLSYKYTPADGQLPGPATATARAQAGRVSGASYDPGHTMVWQPLAATSLPHSLTSVGPTLLWAPGDCRHVSLRGRCPRHAGEIAVAAENTAAYELHLGSVLNPYHDGKPFTVVGIYKPRQDAADFAFWFDSEQLRAVPGRLLSVPPSSLDPVFRPAPWFTTSASIRQRKDPWYVSVDQELRIPSTLTPRSLQDMSAQVAAIGAAARSDRIPSTLSLAPGNALPTVAQTLLTRRTVIRSTVTPAVLSLILVALFLLSRLLSAAMDLRRGELALASLRGYQRRQLWFLGMTEPLLILIAAAPVGVAVGYVTARSLADRWLIAGLPVPFTLPSLLAAVGVLATTAAVAGLVVRSAVSEPLRAQINGERRPTRPARVVVLVRLAVLAAAAAALVTALSRSRPTAPDATDVALPLLLAVGIGLITRLGVLLVSGLWVRRSARRRLLASYLAARTVRRRHEGTLVVLPVTAALTVAVFTVGISSAASAWRTSVADTQVGASLSFPTTMSLNRAVGLTDRLDPHARWLMAAGVNFPSYDFTTPTIVPRVVVDTSRLARVGAWPSQWTSGRSAAQISRALGPRRPPILLRGRRLTVTLSNHVHGDFATLGPTLTVLDDDGAIRKVATGPFGLGRSTSTVTLRHCLTGCRVETIAFGGPDALVEAMHGSVTIDRLTVDGHDVPGILDRPWHAQVSPVGGRPAVVGTPGVSGGRLTVHMSAAGPDSYAAISPDDLPAAVPVLWGRLATPVPRLSTGAGGLFPVRSIGTAESMPLRGPSGMLMDFTSFIRNASLVTGDTFVYVLARADTPQSVLDALAARGLKTPETEASAKHVLDQDAFALALRLYTVVAALVIALALAGLAATLAVQVPVRRRDAASLRVVGVGRLSVMAGMVAEFMTVLGSAAVAGVAAGGLAQYTVVRSVTLGIADDSFTPRALPSFHLVSGARLCAVVLVILLMASWAFAVVTVSRARTSSLRESAR